MAKGTDRPRRRVNGEASRQKILEAATEIAAERGYEGTSIALVSERSGLPASSIYWHFKDKDALIAAVIDHSFETWLGNAIGTDEGSLDVLLQRIGKTLRESTDFLRLGLMLTLERREVEPTARRRFLTVRQEALNRTISTFGRLFPDLDENAQRRLATLAMAVADGVFINTEIEGDGAAVDLELLEAALRGAVEHLRGRG